MPGPRREPSRSLPFQEAGRLRTLGTDLGSLRRSATPGNPRNPRLRLEAAILRALALQFLALLPHGGRLRSRYLGVYRARGPRRRGNLDRTAEVALRPRADRRSYQREDT